MLTFKQMQKVITWLKAHTDLVLLLTLTLLFGFLRFYKLGYSDYISDEPGTFLYRGDPGIYDNMPLGEFILTRRKGPLQLLVGYIPRVIIGSYNNELAQRLPFAAFSVGAILIFYLFIKRITKNKLIAFVGAFLFGVNGLVSAYGRIAQYENLNMFFSFLALYFYAGILTTKTPLRQSLLGTISLCLSFLSHWDVIYVFIPVAYVLVSFILRKEYSAKFKIKLLGLNFLLGCLLILPYFIPYLNQFRYMEKSKAYAEGIIGIGDRFVNRTEIIYSLLYNPFVTLPIYVVAGILGIIVSFKKPIFGVWALCNILYFRFFVKYSGLHFYNLFPPICVLAGYAFWWFSARRRILKIISFGILGLVLAFLYYQTYLLFVDSRIEYPFEREKILFWKTREYTHKDELRHKTGFPHNRYWKEINNYIVSQNAQNNETFSYVTNEYQEISKFYMHVSYGKSSLGYYAVGIKRPLSFATDYQFPQIKGKHTVHTIKNELGETVVKIYWVDPR